MSSHTLKVETLTKHSFAAFGDVIETRDSNSFMINKGSTERFHDLANIDVMETEGRPLLSICRAQTLPLPLRVLMMERHPLSSQAFIPLLEKPFLILVAALAESITINDLHLFLSNGKQGVNYHRGVWHHPLFAINQQTDFMVVDRGGNGENCDEFYFPENEQIVIPKLTSVI